MEWENCLMMVSSHLKICCPYLNTGRRRRPIVLQVADEIGLTLKMSCLFKTSIFLPPKENQNIFPHFLLFKVWRKGGARIWE